MTETPLSLLRQAIEQIDPCMRPVGMANVKDRLLTLLTAVETEQQQWTRAALLKDRTRRAIRERRDAGESLLETARDFGVPPPFVGFLGQPQLWPDDPKIAAELAIRFGISLESAQPPQDQG